MILLIVLVAVIALNVGYAAGRIVGMVRIPHTIASMSLTEIGRLGNRVQELRPDVEETVTR